MADLCCLRGKKRVKSPNKGLRLWTLQKPVMIPPWAACKSSSNNFTYLCIHTYPVHTRGRKFSKTNMNAVSVTFFYNPLQSGIYDVFTQSSTKQTFGSDSSKRHRRANWGLKLDGWHKADWPAGSAAGFSSLRTLFQWTQWTRNVDLLWGWWIWISGTCGIYVSSAQLSCQNTAHPYI